MTHPIDDILNSHTEKLIEGDYGVEIPEDPEEKNLQLIIDLALKSYKEQMEDISMLDIKYRNSAYKIAREYLETAKDARAKMEKLRIDRERGYKAARKSPQGDYREEEGSPTANEGISRKELQERLRAVK